MRTHSIYFSPTGGTKQVMELLAQGLSLNIRIDLSQADADYSAYRFGKDDVCLIGVPVYGGRVPRAALERIRQMQANGALAIPVAVFGNRAYEDTLLELKNEVSACGYVVAAAVAAVAEHSIRRQFGTGRPDAHDQADLRRFSKTIANLISDRERITDFSVPGNAKYREFHGVPFKPKAAGACTRCGLCAEKCPVRAIPRDTPALTEDERCISCMRCVVICPQNARKIDETALYTSSQAKKQAFAGRKLNELFFGES